ncbi:MAG: hypothetical protein HY956_03160 [Deltaproteobacteria bacterium]|nr:hypothetical protein [Deltaproteobacteria bacterium]
MTRIFIILLCLLFLPPLCSATRAEVAEHDYTATSSILFPIPSHGRL